MRKIADLKVPQNQIVRVMIFDEGTGVYLFLYDKREDGPCVADHWLESVVDAEAACVEDFGIDEANWTYIPDPVSDCQHDWINPTRIKRDADGNKLWGQFEPATDPV